MNTVMRVPKADNTIRKLRLLDARPLPKTALKNSAATVSLEALSSALGTIAKLVSDRHVVIEWTDLLRRMQRSLGRTVLIRS